MYRLNQCISRTRIDSIPFKLLRRKHPADYCSYTHEKRASAWLLSSSRRAVWSIARSICFCQHLNGHWCILLALRIMSFGLGFYTGRDIQQDSERKASIKSQMNLYSYKQVACEKLTNNNVSHFLIFHYIWDTSCILLSLTINKSIVCKPLFPKEREKP